METLEIEAKTIDEAIEKACREFSVPREKLNIEIISEGVSGFLGFGQKKAKIRAGLLSIDQALEEVLLEEGPETPAARREKPREKARVREPETAAPPMKAVEVEKPPARQAPPPAEKPSARPAPPALESREALPVKAPVEFNPEFAEKARELLVGILVRMDLEYPVVVEETEDTIRLNIQGECSGLLIGKHGQNLDAIQYIVNKALHKGSNGGKPVVIDIEAYRKRREESLVTLAAKLGEKVKKTRKAVTVSNMNAHDRRIIHLALQNDAALVTKSRGEGEYRKIVIMPSRKGRPVRNEG
ncbi:MAG TPA: RNA-binding cell elongation regulator Jag/EloR [Syntrophales bacterium]|jgi:spoIIIJ-associated protein|nr:RNA-binding cell elongation regulator Jag/EloR [Syntrophales bacterium]